uniref:PiggyBac transposable element-derived protein domain-containing protein n=1 Tax=Micrurus lemniscatus lemniscatus TaxID=129467 RepID=A0A2D4HXE1_MICLE
MDLIEINTFFFGLLLYTSIFRSNHENIKCLLATGGTGGEIFRCVIIETDLLLFFDAFDSVDRKERCALDPTALIAEIFAQFVKNCQEAYTIGTSATIDEVLIGFPGRCKFKMYLPLKPDKYGLKLLCLTDSRNSYFFQWLFLCRQEFRWTIFIKGGPQIFQTYSICIEIS